MDKLSKLSASARVGLTIGLLVVTLVAIIVPGMMEVRWIVQYGVRTADLIRNIAYGIALLSGIGASTIVVWSGSQYILHRRSVATAELEAKQWEEKLPNRSETNRDVIEAWLKRIVKRVPKAGELIGISLDQLDSIYESLDKIGEIFEINAGMIKDNASRYGAVEYLINRVIEQFYPGLVKIIYQAPKDASDRVAVHDLLVVIGDVNTANQALVNSTRGLMNEVVACATQGEDKEAILLLVNEAVNRLKANKTKGQLEV